MRNILLTLLLFTFCLALTAQQEEPEFKMPIWFTDSQGNQDTLWVGYDREASWRDFNPQFGEEEITNPWDSVFEVRAVHAGLTNGADWPTSKIIIEDSDAPEGQCGLFSGTKLMIHARHWPVTISWDSSRLASIYPCNVNTILHPTQGVYILQFWYMARTIHCMATRSSLEVNLPETADDDCAWWPCLSHEYEVEGQGLQAVRGLYITGFISSPPYCLTTVSVEEETEEEVEVTIMPNPVTDQFTILTETYSIDRLEVYDSQGNRIYEKRRPDTDLNVLADRPSGLYFVKMYFDNGLSEVEKLIKR